MSLKSHGVLVAGGAFVILAFVAGLIVGGSFTTATEKPVKTQDLIEFSDAFAEIAEKVNPSVVNIASKEINSPDDSESSDDDDSENLEDQLRGRHTDQSGVGAAARI